MEVLDKGFVRLVDHMGDDSRIVQSARVSYSKGTKTVREDAKLINYLLKNKHWTPFEMVTFTFHVKLPIFIARQWMRHRAGSFNEVSARYSEMPDEFYIPSLERIKAQSKTNKQGSGDNLCSRTKEHARDIMEVNCLKAFADYKTLLDMGVARELARITLPLNLYTEFYWKVDLRNLFNFIALRSDSHAQFEIQEYSNAIYSIIEPIVPHSCASFTESLK